MSQRVNLGDQFNAQNSNLKLTVKPPKYTSSYANIKPSAIKIPENFKKKEELKKLVRSQQRASASSDEQEEERRNADVDENNESKDIENLRRKLKHLREKLFENRSELESFDFGTNEDEQTDDKYDTDEIEIENDLDTDDCTQSQTLLNSGNSVLDSRKDKSRILNELSIQSLDLKANKLIEKSENSLFDKVSSDGLGTSQSSSSNMSSASSNFQDTANPFRPEFLKYIENKAKPSLYENDKPLKPEDDILYQWRLRRKLEEAKKEVVDLSELKSQLQPPSNQTKANTVVKQQVTAQTQTLCVVDTAIQTSLDSTVLAASAKSHDEIPTRDDALEIRKDTSKFEIKFSKKERLNPREQQIKMVSSSPIKRKGKVTTSETASSSELTKISPLTSNENSTPKSELSRQAGLTTLNSSKVSSSISSTISSFSSTITNITNREASPPPPSSLPPATSVRVSSGSRATSTSSSSTTTSLHLIEFSNAKADLNKKLPIDLTNESKQKSAGKNTKNENDRAEDETIDALFESDEILQMLFNKTYFYQMKLNQIDELLTN